MNNRGHALPHPALQYTPVPSHPPPNSLWRRNNEILLSGVYGTRQDLFLPLPIIEPRQLHLTVHPPRQGHPGQYISPPDYGRYHLQHNQPPPLAGPRLAPFLNIPRGSETLPARLAPLLLPRYVPRLAPAGSDPWTNAWPPAPPPPPRATSASVITTTNHPRHGPQETTFQHYDDPELPHLTTNEAVPHPAITRYPPPEDDDDAPGPRILMMDLSGDDSPEPEPEGEEPQENTGESAEGAGEGPSGVSRHDTPGETGLATAAGQTVDQPGSTVASAVAAPERADLKRGRDTTEDDDEERERKRQETEGKV